jgi:hypothetical protein
MRSTSHSPVPIFQEQECSILFVGWCCLQCGIELMPSQIFPRQEATRRPDLRENARNITAHAIV